MWLFVCLLPLSMIVLTCINVCVLVVLWGFRKYKCHKNCGQDFKWIYAFNLWCNTSKNGWIIWKHMFNFVRKLPNCFLKWLYHLTFPPIISFSTTISSAIFYILCFSTNLIFSLYNSYNRGIFLCVNFHFFNDY